MVAEDLAAKVKRVAGVGVGRGDLSVIKGA